MFVGRAVGRGRWNGWCVWGLKLLGPEPYNLRAQQCCPPPASLTVVQRM